MRADYPDLTRAFDDEPAYNLLAKMSEPDKPQSKNVPLYAQGTFDRELNYKMWSTYKARFNAASRLHRKHNLSTRAVALLSAYVAIFSVITAIFGDALGAKEADVLLVVGVSLSIVILVIGLLETSQNYSVRADRFHQSGLDIAELYKALRSIKSRYKEKEKDHEFFQEIDKIRDKYNDILQRSENHEDIDHECFRAAKPKYEDHSLNIKDVKRIKRRLYWGQFFPYYAAMALPPILFGIALFYSVRLDAGNPQEQTNKTLIPSQDEG